MSVTWLSNDLLDTTLKAQAAKEKLDKLDFTNKKLTLSKDTIKKVKKTTQRMGENICK